jgi:hypothetical protein
VASDGQSCRPDLPALLVTGYTNLAQGPGAELPQLTKPFRQAELAARVAELLDTGRLQANVVRLPDKKRGRMAAAD